MSSITLPLLSSRNLASSSLHATPLRPNKQTLSPTDNVSIDNFQIVLWTSVVLVIAFIFASTPLFSMDFSNDTLLFQ